MMTEKLTCPYCRHLIDIDLVDTTGLWRERDAIKDRFGNVMVWNLANEYVNAFREDTDVLMALKKRVRLLNEVLALWESGTYIRKDKSYRVSKDAILAAMRKFCNMQKTGFSKHEYLYEILGDSAERISAEGLTARDEKKREEGRRLKAEDRASNSDPDFGTRMGEIAKNIGRRMP